MQYKFFGTVYPSGHLANVPYNKIPAETVSGVKFNVSYHVHANKAVVILDIDSDEFDIHTLKYSVKSLVLDALAAEILINACYFDLEFEVVFYGDSYFIFGSNIPDLVDRLKNNQVLVDNLGLLMKDKDGMWLRDAIRNINLAIKDPADTSFYCYRSIECIKEFYAERNGITNDKKKWDNYWAKIGSQRSEIEIIFRHQGGLRHGVSSDLMPDDRKIMLDLAFKHVEQLINFRISELGKTELLERK